MPTEQQAASKDDLLDATGLRAATGYMPIENYGLIGNMRTAALVATDGGLDYLCWPDFDSPSIFCRILDREKGGHFTISPPNDVKLTTKQRYLPSSNILQTMFYGEDGVMKLIDFFPRPAKVGTAETLPYKEARISGTDADLAPSLRRWLVRRVECVRGEIGVTVLIDPAFNYAQDEHRLYIRSIQAKLAGEVPQEVIFVSKDHAIEFRATAGPFDGDIAIPEVKFEVVRRNGRRQSVQVRLRLMDGQRVSFVMRDHDRIGKLPQEHVTPSLLDRLQQKTKQY